MKRARTRNFIAGLIGTAIVAAVAAGPFIRTVEAAEASKDIPMTVTADKLDYDKTADRYTAQGHVRIEQKGTLLEADHAIMDNRSGEAEVDGHVTLQDDTDLIHATRLNINLQTHEGTIQNGDIFMKKLSYHLRGDVIERKSESRYRIEHGMFTTCDENDWFIKADEMRIDMNRYATGDHVTLNLGGVPVLYTPYLLFPVRRQSGLLIPDLGYSSKDGFFMENAVFWAISDSRDMTFYSDYRARTGLGTAAEYRYNNSRESMGQVYAKAWDLHDTGVRDTGVWRWDFRLQHQEELADDLSAKADINLVSDEKYYYDLEKKLEMRSLPSIDSNVFAVQRWNAASLSLLGQYTTDLTHSNEATVQKLPEVRYTIYEAALAGPMHFNFDGTAVNFSRREGLSARRADFAPELTTVFSAGGLSLTPRAGARATFYDHSVTDKGLTTSAPVERHYTYAGADLNTRLVRVYGEDGDEGIGKIRHSIEPSVSYTYRPHVNQADLPQFDAVDNVAAQNVTNFVLLNRVTAHYKERREDPNYSTFDLAVLRISQSYDLNVMGSPQSADPSRSGILGELSINTPKSFSLAANATYDTYHRLISSRSEGATWKGEIVTLNLSEQYLQSPPTHFLIGGGEVKYGKWDVSSQLWRDVQNRKTTQEEYHVRYAAQCWGVSTAYVRRPGEIQYTMTLDLKGIGGAGNR
jgi:LPS-assembly protein